MKIPENRVLRDALIAFFKQHQIREHVTGLRLEGQYFSPSTQQHALVEHLSSYDRQANHYHLIFSDYVSFVQVSQLIESMNQAATNDDTLQYIFAQQSRSAVLDIAYQYFKDQQKNKKAEEDFRQCMQHLLKPLLFKPNQPITEVTDEPCRIRSKLSLK